MISEAVWEQSARADVVRLKAGERVVVSDHTLNAILAFDPEFSKSIRSCFNRKAVGALDTYVAWVADAAKPTDLEFRADMTAVGSP